MGIIIRRDFNFAGYPVIQFKPASVSLKNLSVHTTSRGHASWYCSWENNVPGIINRVWNNFQNRD